MIWNSVIFQLIKHEDQFWIPAYGPSHADLSLQTKEDMFRACACGCWAELEQSSWGRGNSPFLQVLDLGNVSVFPPIAQTNMRSVSPVLLLIPVLLVLPALAAPGCGPCEPAVCRPLPLGGCQTGSVLDYCGCCSVCAAAEGEACGGRRAGARRCGSGLECSKSNTDKKSKQGVCLCKSDHEVCGSDGATYRNVCGLRSASLAAQAQGRQPLSIQNKGRCAAGESEPSGSYDCIWSICKAPLSPDLFLYI